MATFANNIISFVDSARPIIVALVAIAVLITGAMMIYPSERSKEKAKDALPFILIGCALALGAVAIANSLTSSF